MGFENLGGKTFFLTQTRTAVLLAVSQERRHLFQRLAHIFILNIIKVQKILELPHYVMQHYSIFGYIIFLHSTFQDSNYQQLMLFKLHIWSQNGLEISNRFILLNAGVAEWNFFLTFFE